jgi:peptidoglycan/xylan/chitin deacetylase (PgdA/CDA1 family)
MRETVALLRPARLVKHAACALLYYTGLLALLARWCPPPGPIILCAHRVVAEDDPFFPGIRRDRFAAEVAYLARHRRVVPLAEIVDAVVSGRPVRRGAVAITLDDGFADNYTLAWPILAAHGVPATIFLVSDSIESGRLPWPDRLAWILRETAHSRLELRGPVTRTFSLATREARLAALEELRGLLKACSTEARRAAMEEIEAALAVPADHGQMLTWAQCRTMAAGGITFGAHTATHPILPRTDALEVKRELADSKAAIEARLGRPAAYFAYPNDDWSPSNAEAVEEAGFEAALAGAAGPGAGPNRFAVTRRAWSLGAVSVFTVKVSGVLDWLEPLVGAIL